MSHPSARRQDRANILGVGFTAAELPALIERVAGWIADGDGGYVCLTNTHVVMEARRSETLRQALNAGGMTLADGRPVMWTARLIGRRDVPHVRGADFVDAVCSRGAGESWKHYLYGGAEGVPERAAAELSRRHPGIQIAGCYSPPFRDLTEEEDEQAVARINAAGADVVWVGLGAPKQEYWMASHHGRLSASVVVGVGAVFDFLSGRRPEAPRWMQRAGLEWLFRVGADRRLLRRYAVNNPRFVLAAALQVLGMVAPRPLAGD